jgi:hypothetical protein
MPEDIGKETAAFLRDYQLESLQSQIATIVRLLPPVRYHEEVSRIQMPPDLRLRLLLAMGNDASNL